MKKSALTIGAATLLAQGTALAVQSCAGKCNGFTPTHNDVRKRTEYAADGVTVLSVTKFKWGICKDVNNHERTSWKKESANYTGPADEVDAATWDEYKGNEHTGGEKIHD